MDNEIKQVVWTTRATKDLEKITLFYAELYGLDKVRKIITEIRQSTEILVRKNINTSQIGSIDKAFLHLKRDYRKFIKHHCKITLS